jgi:hypothetical protein
LIVANSVNKVCTEFDLIRVDGRYPSTPLSSTSRLLPYDGVSEPSNTKTYQRLVGNLAYMEVMTRPDVAHAHSILARFLINPGPVHLSDVRVRWVDHKCKVKSDEFDREATRCSWWVYICPVVLSSRSFQQFLERRRSSESSTEGPHSNEGLSLS